MEKPFLMFASSMAKGNREPEEVRIKSSMRLMGKETKKGLTVKIWTWWCTLVFLVAQKQRGRDRKITVQDQPWKKL